MGRGAAPLAVHPGVPAGTGGLPDRFAAMEAAARVVLEAARGADEWDAATRRRALAVLDRAANALLVAKGKVISAEHAAGTWWSKGDRDLAGFVGRESRQGRGAGFAAVGQAMTLAAMPQVADALVDGPVTSKHVEEITRATSASPKLAAELATPEGQARVVELAGRLDGQEFGRRLRQMSAAADPASRQREHDRQRAERFLAISHLPGGTLVRGRLDGVAGHEFAKAIEALNPRPAQDDDRSDAQRRADALMVMVHRTATDRATTPGSVAPVQAVVTLSEDTWIALRGARDDVDVSRGAGRRANGEPSRGSTADVVAALRGAPPVVDEDGRSWPAGEVARALCDCALTRAVVDAAGQVLDLGRSQRLFGRSHWSALYASGQRTCAYPGCSMPLRYTELHHLAWWDRDGGTTDQANCGPECRYHHQWIHDHDIRVSRLPDGRYEHRDRHGRLIGRDRTTDDGEPPGPPGGPSDRPPESLGGDAPEGPGDRPPHRPPRGSRRAP